MESVLVQILAYPMLSANLTNSVMGYALINVHLLGAHMDAIKEHVFLILIFNAQSTLNVNPINSAYKANAQTNVHI